ncbi:transposase [Ramlibacter sp. MAHUQ-53]|uniref:transposase n=1 Tax=unclassified Ramlibacter TaxID=2617605 RepID=UPI00363877E7
MARPLRIEFPGCLYHVTSRGDRREAIYEDDHDRRVWLDLLAEACDRFHWVCHAWCQMTNHYHLMVETVEPTLSRGMRHLNGVFTQWSNRRHERTGHLFQGRFKAIVVEKESHLLELSRYIVLNPVRGGMVRLPGDWPWSSWHATAGLHAAPGWLDVDWLLARFARDRAVAMDRYRRFVLGGIGLASPLRDAAGQGILGSEPFVQRVLGQARAAQAPAEVPRLQRHAKPQTLADYAAGAPNASQAMAHAYASGGYSLREIAEHFGVHYSTVSRAVRGSGVGGGGRSVALMQDLTPLSPPFAPVRPRSSRA